MELCRIFFAPPPPLEGFATDRGQEFGISSGAPRLLALLVAVGAGEAGQTSKLMTRVRFPSPAPINQWLANDLYPRGMIGYNLGTGADR
jgi:hypothetical protein